MQKRRAELTSLAHQWKSQLQTIPEYCDKYDLTWWPTSSGEEGSINGVPQLPSVPKQLNWDDFMDDTSSMGGDIEGDAEEDPGLVEAMQALEESYCKEAVDPMSDVWFEGYESENEGHSHTKRRKFV